MNFVLSSKITLTTNSYKVSTTVMANKFKLALIQLAVGASKTANLERAGSLIREAASKGAQLVALPVKSRL